MKKEVAILTQPLGRNYGGIIQNYALQKVLEKMGYHPITINRKKDLHDSKLTIQLNQFKSLVSRYVFKRKHLTHLDYKKLYKNTSVFLKQYVNMSSDIYSTDDLKTYFGKKHFSYVIVGSDQVWRPKYSPNIFNFYLDFLKNNSSIKKIAYAASFGTDEWEYTDKETTSCKTLIPQFDAISVRENSAINLCSHFLERDDAIHVLDPAFLLTSEEYSQLINREKSNKGLFTYVLDENVEKLNFISKCATSLNLKIHSNQSKKRDNHLKIENINDYIMPSLEGWLQGFRDAEFVITDSFHGTVFSILNQKPFFAIVNKERGASRFESMLKQLDLMDRLVYDVTYFDMQKLESKIDYKNVYHKLNELKEYSFNFLKFNL